MDQTSTSRMKVVGFPDRSSGSAIAGELSPIVWLWTPVCVLAGITLLGLISLTWYRRTMMSEFGFIENLTVVLCGVGVWFGIQALRQRQQLLMKSLAYWIALVTAGSFYFGGEEMSWGQHFAGWATPETWQTVNDQQETNLHNTSPLFDQLPRLLLSVGALVGGIVIPLVVRRMKPRWWQPKHLAYWMFPTMVCLPVACGVILTSVGFTSGWHAYRATAPGEVKELCLAGFLCLYLVSISRRLEQQKLAMQADVHRSQEAPQPSVAPARRAA